MNFVRRLVIIALLLIQVVSMFNSSARAQSTTRERAVAAIRTGGRRVGSAARRVASPLIHRSKRRGPHARPLLNGDPETPEEAIRRVVRDSQYNETLVIYVYPSNFDQALLSEYWVPEDKGGKAILQVENSVRRLIDNGWHYAKESANERFEITSVTIFAPGDVADVRTRERWNLRLVDENGWLVKDRDSILEYPVTYRVLKIDGKWMIQKSSTPYHD